MMSRGKQFKELIHKKEILIQPGVYDGYSVRLIERAGFKTASISGAGVSESRMGWADRGVMTFEENLNNARRLADCSDLLLRADADTGYGNAMTVHFVVRAFEKAGMAALMIEDQVWPKRCGHMAGKSCIPAEEMVQKVKAAVDARRDHDFVIVSRTDAAGPHGVDEAIRRLNMYAEAGADVMYADALTSEAELERCAKEIKGPLHFNRTGVSPRLPVSRLNELGIAMVSNATGSLRSSTVAMVDYFAEFAKDDVEAVKRFEARTKDHPAGNMHAFIGFSDIKKLEEEFLPSADVLAKYEGSVGFQP